MSANDQVQCEVPTQFPAVEHTFDAANQMDPLPTVSINEEDDSWMDVHTLNVVPAKRTFTFLAEIVNLGRGTPSIYLDPLGESED